jgi:hypothetical protein
MSWILLSILHHEFSRIPRCAYACASGCGIMSDPGDEEVEVLRKEQT